MKAVTKSIFRLLLLVFPGLALFAAPPAPEAASAEKASDRVGVIRYLVLKDPVTQKDLRLLKTKDQIYADVPVNIRISTKGKVKSVDVRFGTYYRRTDNTPPFSVGGDEKGQYKSWLPRTGTHQLRVTPYSQANLKGIKGKTFTIQLTVQPPPDIRFSLVREDAEFSEVMEITDGAEIDLSAIPFPELNIRATVEGQQPGSIRFGWDGNPDFRVDNAPPFLLFIDHHEDDYRPWQPLAGTYTLTATAFAKDNASGNIGATKTVTFRILPSIRFSLVDEYAPETELLEITDGAEIDLATIPFPELNIRAEVEAQQPGSIRFGWDGNPGFRVDNAPPFLLFIDHHEDDYRIWAPEPGTYTLTATAFSEDSASGNSGPTKTVTFRIVDSTPEPVTGYIEFNNLVVVYKNSNKGSIPDGFLPQLTPSLEETRLFYWRNSHMGIHLKWTVYVIEEFLERVGRDDQVDPKLVDADLRSRGFTDGSYDAVVVVIEGGGSWAFGANQVLGRGGYCQVPWWGHDQMQFSWFFVHEFNHVVDNMFANSGHPLYPHNHPDAARSSGEYVPPSGLDWDLNAGIFRHWKYADWLDLRRKGNWGLIKLPVDADGDTIPDLEPGVPLDEARFNSSPASADTDADGLTDLQEAMAGIFTASNPLSADSDGDNIQDALDPEPVYPLNTGVPFHTGLSLAQEVSSWPLAGHYYFRKPDPGATSLHLAHSRDQLYVGLRVPSGVSRLRVVVDANNDGHFHGRDNLEIILNQNTIESVTLWDAVTDFPADSISQLPTTGFSGATKSDGAATSYQLIIPRLSEYGLDLTAGEKVGLVFHVFNYGYLLEQDDALSVTLAGPGTATLPGQGQVPARTGIPGVIPLVFPNPANDRLHIRLEAPGGAGWFSIWNANGVEQLRSQMTGQGLQTVDIAKLPPGFYWLRIDSPGAGKPMPFIKR